MKLARLLAQRFTASRRRHYSDYHSKVRAFPFAFSAEDAISHVGIAASMASYVGRSRPSNVPVTALFASVLARYFPMSGFKPLQPTRVQALYFPTWFVSTELEATAWFSSRPDAEESQGGTATVQFDDLYLPGFGMDIGRVLVRDPPTNFERAKPFSPDLAHQWGLDVMCLPYNVLPFDILDRTRMFSYTDAVINENMRFNPQSIKMNLAAAYPVLLPVYLAQYISKEPWPPVTIICAAHSDPGVHYVHVPHPDTDDSTSVRLPFEELMMAQDDYVAVGPGSISEGADIRAIVVHPTSDQPLSNELSVWLNDQFQQRNAPVSMATNRPIDMEDLRIREWTQEEMDPVNNWLRMGRARTHFRHTILKNVNLDASQISSIKPGQETRYVVDLFKSFLQPDPEWEQTRAASIPEWWRRWEESRKSQRCTPPRS